MDGHFLTCYLYVGFPCPDSLQWAKTLKLLDPLFCFNVAHSPEIVWQVDHARVGRMIYWGAEEEARERDFLLEVDSIIVLIFLEFS